MPALLEPPEHQASPIQAQTQPVLDEFLQSLVLSKHSALLLDFDGTLAPFRLDPSAVRPWAGIASLLDKIQHQGHTRIAIVSGRPAHQVKSQLGLKTTPEIWGLHGAERLLPSGKLELEQLLPAQEQTLKEARAAIRNAGLGLRNEEKWNAVVVHWRGRSPRFIESARTRALILLQPFAEASNMTLLQFDGGIELRAGRNKGDAVRLLLESLPDRALVAYLGDDTTDEDAFKAIAGRGLGVLVRREWRTGAAQLWLRPPTQLREFLTSWLKATQVHS